jgi:hypothetical protein
MTPVAGCNPDGSFFIFSDILVIPASAPSAEVQSVLERCSRNFRLFLRAVEAEVCPCCTVIATLERERFDHLKLRYLIGENQKLKLAQAAVEATQRALERDREPLRRGADAPDGRKPND